MTVGNKLAPAGFLSLCNAPKYRTVVVPTYYTVNSRENLIPEIIGTGCVLRGGDMEREVVHLVTQN
jgi:hypothetical protein